MCAIRTADLIMISSFVHDPGDQLWELRDDGVERPQPISDVFPELPNDIEAALYFGRTNITYFFKVTLKQQQNKANRNTQKTK